MEDAGKPGRHTRISRKLAAMYLVALVPLVAILMLVYQQWRGAAIATAEQERHGDAQVLAASFELLVRDMQRTAESVGRSWAATEFDPEQASGALRRLQRTYPLASASLTDHAGRVTVSSDPDLVGTDLSGQTAFRWALSRTMGDGIEPTQRWPGGVVGFHVASRIDDSRGGTSGVMMLLVDVSQLPRALDLADVRRGGTSLVDSQGRLIMQSDDAKLVERRADWGAQYPWVQQALDGETATVSDWDFPLGDGSPRIGVFVPITSYGWAAGSTLEVEQALALFNRSELIGLPLVGFAALLSLLMGRYMAERIKDSLAVLALDAARIGSGELEQPVESDRTDEIGDVARSLEEARVRLRRQSGELHDELETTRLLLEAANRLSAPLALDSLLGALAELTLRTVPHLRVTVSLLAEDRSYLRLAAGAGQGMVPPGTIVLWPDASAPLRDALTRGERTIIDYDEFSVGDRGVSPKYAGRLALIVPLVYGGRVLGHLGVDDPGIKREFSQRDIEVAEGMASQAAVVIEKARLFEEQKENAAYAEALNRINEAVHATLEFDEIMQRVVVVTTDVAGLDVVAIQLRENERWRLAHSHGVPEELMRGGEPLAAVALANSVIARGEPIVVSDSISGSVDDDDNAWMSAVHGLLALPLFVRGEPLGVLYAGSRESGAVQTDAMIDFVMKVASTLSLALDNARLYEIEHGVAETLQEALLSLPDRIPGVEFAHAYRSASVATRVGGDFYDVFEMEHGRIGIVIGDVAGKGLQAAVLTSLVKNTIRAHAAEADKTPAATLQLTNRRLYEETATESFVTVFFGVLDCREGRLTYANAGHTTAVRCRSGGGVETLSANSPILGAFSDTAILQRETSMDVADMLFLYTDGLTEARAADEFFGEERVVRMLSEMEDVEPIASVRLVIEGVLAFTGGSLTDDLAVLALKRLDSQEGPLQHELGVLETNDSQVSLP